MPRRQAAKFAHGLVSFDRSNLNLSMLPLAAIMRPFLSRVVASMILPYG